MEHTFVICAYKDSRYLPKCIESLKNQTIKSSILLATSTPSSYLSELCRHYGLTYHIRDGIPGIGPDWNYALSLADTEYVTIAHQDDVYESKYLERIMAYEKRTSKEMGSVPMFLFTDYSELVGEEKEENRRNLKIKRMLLTPLKPMKYQGRQFAKRAALQFGNAICCPTVTYHMAYIKKRLLGTDRPALFQEYFRSNLDWEAWEWLSRQQGAFVYIPEILMAHRIHAESETSAVIQESRRRAEDYEMFCKFWPKWFAKIITGVYGQSEKSNEL